MEAVALVAALGIALTKAIDGLRNAFDTHDTAPPWTWNALSIVGGLALAFVFELDLLATVGPMTHASRYAGTILTGFAVSGLAGGSHEVLDALSGIAKRARETRKSRAE